MPRARLIAFDPVGEMERHRVDDALCAAGVVLDSGSSTGTDTPRLVCFSTCSDAFLRLLHSESLGGWRRVIAIALPPFGASDSVWSLVRHGATDVYCWQDGAASAGEIAARLTRWEAVDGIAASPLVRENLIGNSAAWLAAVRQVVEVAMFTDVPLLVRGETGTGKELIARLVHTLDRRPVKKNLILVDCTTLARDLAGSELFGHERGAFTSAVAAREGACALADGGTLFLDEIGELPTTLQSELLRVVQEGTYKRIGSNAWRRTQFRLICATNRDLERAMERGRFRRDLYYRIAGATCTLPPLRERRGDILELVVHFISTTRNELSPEQIVLDEVVRDYLQRRDYPGNVRDLRQLIARILARHAGSGHITVGDLPLDERPGSDGIVDWRDSGFRQAIRRALDSGVGLREIGRATAEMAIGEALRDARSLRAAARRLGVTDRALQLRRAGARPRRARTKEASPDHEPRSSILG